MTMVACPLGLGSLGEIAFKTSKVSYITHNLIVSVDCGYVFYYMYVVFCSKLLDR